MSQKEEENREQDEDDGRDPPDRFDPSRLHLSAKLAPDEFVVIEIVVRQVQAVLEMSVVAPPGIVVGAAMGTSERSARDIFAANGTDFRGIGFRGHGLFKSTRLAIPMPERRRLKIAVA
jgi:hypothetical protein